MWKLIKQFIVITFFLSGFLSFSFARTLPDIEKDIKKATITLLTDTLLENRKTSADLITNLFKEAFKNDESFSYPFSSIRAVSIQTPPDQSFRIFSWQLFVDNETYKYFGLIQMNDKKKSVFELTDKARHMRNPEFKYLSTKNWYGALYYKILEHKTKGKKRYVLLGYNAHSFFNRRKLIEVLHFQNGQPRFGDKILNIKDISGRERGVNRYLLEYSAAVSIRLNYDEERQMIVFDHLIASGVFEGKPPSNVPDGSYDGLVYRNGVWYMEEELFKDAPKLEDGEAPVPEPKKEKDGLFRGNRKN